MFAGWAETPDGEVKYSDRGYYVMGPNSVNELYAVWQAKVQYTVTYNGNRGTSGGSSQITKVWGADISAETVKDHVKFTRAGYKFVGWDTEVQEPLTGDLTLTAVWAFDETVMDPRMEVEVNADGTKTITAGGLGEIDGADYTYVWWKKDASGQWVKLAGANSSSILIPAGDSYEDYRVDVIVNGLDAGAGNGSGGNGDGSYVYEGDSWTGKDGGTLDGVNAFDGRSSGLSLSQKIIIAVAIVVGVLLLLLIVVLVAKSVARERRKQENNNYRWY
jgi:hypothetical protein